MAEINGAQLAVLMERTEAIRSDTKEMVAKLKHLEQEMVEFREGYIIGHNEVVSAAKYNTVRLDKIEPRVDKLEGDVAPLKFGMKILSFIGAALGASIVALIWTMITGQVTVIFP